MPASQENRSDAPSNNVLTGSSQPHTPGPWNLDQGDWRNHSCCYAYAVTAFHNGERATIAECDRRNARLIAAAPELLEALKSAASYLRDAMRDTAWSEAEDFVTRAETLISKAEGR